MVSKRILVVVMTMLAAAFAAGCGAPQYAKDYWKIDPQTGEMTHWSAQQTNLAVGQIDAGVNSDGTKFMRVGTATQPAIVYGADPIGAMTVYALQQEKYTQMLDVVGKNLIGQIDALGGLAGQILGGLAGIRSAGVAIGGPLGTSICSSCDSLTTQVQNLKANADSAKTIFDQLQTLQAAKP